jgi:hypothetical protein
MDRELVPVNDILMNEANIPYQYRVNLPRMEQIPNVSLIKDYFEPVYGYETVPPRNIFVHSFDYKFASQVAAKVIMGFLARRTVCYCSVTMLVKGLVERESRNESISGWDLLTGPRVLGLFNLGQEPTNDFGKTISAVTQVLAFRSSVGLPTVISSDETQEDIMSDVKRFPKPLADLIFDDCLIVDVNSN